MSGVVGVQLFCREAACTGFLWRICSSLRKGIPSGALLARVDCCRRFQEVTLLAVTDPSYAVLARCVERGITAMGAYAEGSGLEAEPLVAKVSSSMNAWRSLSVQVSKPAAGGTVLQHTRQRLSGWALRHVATVQST